MIHYAFLQFEEGFMDDSVLEKFQRTYDEIVQTVDGVESAEVIYGQRLSPVNADIAIRMSVRDEAALMQYENGELHEAHKARFSDHIRGVMYFDARDEKPID